MLPGPGKILRILMFIMTLSLLFSLTHAEDPDLYLLENNCVNIQTSVQLILPSEREDSSVTNYTIFTNQNISEVEIYNGPLSSMGELTSFAPSKTAHSVTFPEVGDYLYKIIPVFNNSYNQSEGLLTIINCSSSVEKKYTTVIEYDSLELSSTSPFSPFVYEYEEFEPLSFQQLDDATSQTFFLKISLTQNLQVPDLFINSSHRVWYLDNSNNWIETDSEVIPHFGEKTLRIAFEEVESSETLVIEEEIETENINETINETQENSIEEETSTETVENIPTARSTNVKPKELELSDSSVVDTSGNSIVIYFIGFLLVIVIVFAGFNFYYHSRSSSSYGDGENVTDIKQLSESMLETKVHTFYELNKDKLSPEQIVQHFELNGVNKERVIEILKKYQPE